VNFTNRGRNKRSRGKKKKNKKRIDPTKVKEGADWEPPITGDGSSVTTFDENRILATQKIAN